MQGRHRRRRASRLRRAAVPRSPVRAMPARRHWRPHSGRGRAWRAWRRRLPAMLVPARSSRPQDRKRRVGRSHREAASSRTGARCLHQLRSAPPVGRSVAEQRSHRRCSALAASAQGRVGESPHDGAASRAAALRLGVYLGEEIVWKGDHDLCHAASIPRYTSGFRCGKKWARCPPDSSRSPRSPISRIRLETHPHVVQPIQQLNLITRRSQVRIPPPNPHRERPAQLGKDVRLLLGGPVRGRVWRRRSAPSWCRATRWTPPAISPAVRARRYGALTVRERTDSQLSNPGTSA